jgi:hypothetical protein
MSIRAKAWSALSALLGVLLAAGLVLFLLSVSRHSSVSADGSPDAVGTCTYGQPLSTYINEESNIRQIHYAPR